jgi:hypothetical protein
VSQFPSLTPIFLTPFTRRMPAASKHRSTHSKKPRIFCSALMPRIASDSVRKEIIISTSTGTTSSASVYTSPPFWERLRRTAGIQSVLCFIVAYILHGS